MVESKAHGIKDASAAHAIQCGASGTRAARSRDQEEGKGWTGRHYKCS